MKEITKCITLDLQRRGNTRMIFARQNDMLSRQIRIALTAGGVSYPVPKDTVALLNILRADGESAAFAAEITDDGEIEITLSLWMLSSAGETRCSVSLIDSDGRTLTSEDFTLDVLETLYVCLSRCSAVQPVSAPKSERRILTSSMLSEYMRIWTPLRV